MRNATPSQVGVPSPLQAPVTEPRHGVALAKTEENKAIRGRPASAARLGVAPKGAKTEENKAAQQKVNIPLPVSETGTGRFGFWEHKYQYWNENTKKHFHLPHAKFDSIGKSPV